jgi:hypothetical protein
MQPCSSPSQIVKVTMAGVELPGIFAALVPVEAPLAVCKAAGRSHNKRHKPRGRYQAVGLSEHRYATFEAASGYGPNVLVHAAADSTHLYMFRADLRHFAA